ncbi:hypothetical protein F4778DRAFT_780260 [Xylariomycetidae sp. FL2044]|nr:hypothetical protein F4778DRAFT_780260 [Xylariomycetidae sp. FL2044]
MVNETPFRLLDLPREVRDMIYYEMLCSWPDPEFDPYACCRWVRPGVNTAILVANRQVSIEAKDVMWKGNKFIRVIAHGCGKLAAQVPVVCTTPLIVEAFKGYVMTHSVDAGHLPQSMAAQFMILQRDLDLLCQYCCVRRIISKPHHCITIHNPFENTSDASYMNGDKQKLLLEPYAKHFRNFPSFEIRGHVDEGLSQTVTQKVRELLPPDLEAFRSELIRKRALGAQYLAANKPRHAYQVLDLAYHQALDLFNGRHMDFFEATASEAYKTDLYNIRERIDWDRHRAWRLIARGFATLRHD